MTSKNIKLLQNDRKYKLCRSKYFSTLAPAGIEVFQQMEQKESKLPLDGSATPDQPQRLKSLVLPGKDVSKFSVEHQERSVEVDSVCTRPALTTLTMVFFPRHCSSLLLAFLLACPPVVMAYITSHQALPVPRQMAWLKQMTREFTTSKPGELSADQLSTAPNLIYALAHAREASKENALIVESMVKRLIDEQRAGNDAVMDLTVDDYNCLLESWSHSGEGAAAAERCEQILQAMQDHGLLPNLTSFKAVLMAWRQATQCSYAPFRAQRILEWMILLHANGDNDASFPDVECFDLCLQTWSRSGHAKAPQKAEELLVSMERLYEQTQLESIQPRATSFNAVLAAWARSRQENSADRAADILSFMETLPNVSPDAASYCTVLTALSRSHPDPQVAATKATVFLQHALDRATASANQDDKQTPTVEMDTILFNTAMGLWSKTNAPKAFLKASSILQLQRQLYLEHDQTSCRPDVFGFTSVLACCASVPASKYFLDAWEIAVATYDQLRTEDKANHVSYATMLKACGRLLSNNPKQRHYWARQVFQHAVDAGCVNSFVLKRLELAVPPKMYRSLLQGHSPDNLPESWTANIHEQPRTKTYRRRRRAEV